MVDQSQSLSYRTQSNPQRAHLFYPTNANNSLILNDEINASGPDLNKINPSILLRNNSKILRNSKVVGPATHANGQMQRVFAQPTSARGFDSFQEDALQDLDGAQKVQNGQPNNFQKPKNFQGYFAPKTHRVQQN